jgi:hypothetical protein
MNEHQVALAVAAPLLRTVVALRCIGAWFALTCGDASEVVPVNRFFAKPQFGRANAPCAGAFLERELEAAPRGHDPVRSSRGAESQLGDAGRPKGERIARHWRIAAARGTKLVCGMAVDEVIFGRLCPNGKGAGDRMLMSVDAKLGCGVGRFTTVILQPFAGASVNCQILPGSRST